MGSVPRLAALNEREWCGVIATRRLNDAEPARLDRVVSWAWLIERCHWSRHF